MSKMKARILIMEDEEDFQDILRQTLEPAGYELSFADDGRKGLEFLSRDPADLVILDVNLPVRNGYEICQSIRANPEWADLPVLMLTIRNRDEEIVRGLDSGADDYLTKPFEPSELSARIRKLLNAGE